MNEVVKKNKWNLTLIIDFEDQKKGKSAGRQVRRAGQEHFSEGYDHRQIGSLSCVLAYASGGIIDGGSEGSSRCNAL